MNNLDRLFDEIRAQYMLFTEAEIETLENRAKLKPLRGKQVLFVECLVRKKDVQLKPEEAVRQLLLEKLSNEYGYNYNNMRVEYPVRFGRDSSKRAVEIAIEKDETAAVDFINREVD